ncbi:spermidine synthase [Actinopolyspora biskrensis]|uniref:Spermidine synthase n=1 Tax=Actinopolyspora biskrensis TaxID=1470178 RepID=A0A852YV77_9ACTN|nr:hypothetical protein [Actinopolyspora biskrensis]NYH79054.1 spermidine synthase [Actinopolyspora biskrensis]
MANTTDSWLREPIRDDLVDMWRLHEVHCTVDTDFQRVLIANTRLGVTLFCDDNPQSAENGQLIFHEAELIPAVLLAEHVRSILVIGCSEGTVPLIAAELGTEHVDHVDIDPECVRLCADHLPYGYTPEDLKRAERGEGVVRLHYADGADFVTEALRRGDRYDVIVLDLPEEDENPAAGHNAMYGQGFFTTYRKLLTPGGVLSTHVSRSHLSFPTAETAESLRRPWTQLGNTFGTRVFFRSTEHPWAAIMLATPAELDEPVRLMRERLPELARAPRTIDAAELRGATYPPLALR